MCPVSITVAKSLRLPTKNERNLFSLTILEIEVHDPLGLFFCTYGRTDYDGRNICWKKLLILCYWKQIEKDKGGQGLDSPSSDYL